jgi:hypothetical protein
MTDTKTKATKWKRAPISEVGGILVVPNWLTTRGNPIAIQHGLDGMGCPIFCFVEVWPEQFAITSLRSGAGRATYRSLGEARAAAGKLLGMHKNDTWQEA